MSAGNIARHRNYGDIIERHERDQKWKRMFRVFIYFLIVAFLSIILVIVVRWEKRKQVKAVAQSNLVTYSAFPPGLL